jgi:hypothetical protein
VAGLGGAPVSELIIVGASEAFFPVFEEALWRAGFGHWALPDWPGGPSEPVV